jgi:hypothetical protein
MSRLNTCNVSACNGSVNTDPDMSCNTNVNALSMVVPNECADLNGLNLPKFKNSAKQVVIHFLCELDGYFTLKKMPNELRLPLCFRAIKDPFAKQWFATVYDAVGTYEKFKIAFANLLWGQTCQAQIRCNIYQDCWDKSKNDMYTEHYIRCAGVASMLNPEMLKKDLVGVMINHFSVEAQSSAICSNLKTTQETLSFLGENADIRIYPRATQETTL